MKNKYLNQKIDIIFKALELVLFGLSCITEMPETVALFEIKNSFKSL